MDGVPKKTTEKHMETTRTLSAGVIPLHFSPDVITLFSVPVEYLCHFVIRGSRENLPSRISIVWRRVRRDQVRKRLPLHRLPLIRRDWTIGDGWIKHYSADFS